MSHIEDLSAITTPSLNDLLYVYQNGSDYQITTQQLLNLIKANSVIPLTQAQYDALPSEEKNNGAIYIITDASVTISDIAGADTFIHDMSFASSFDNRSELAINETTDGLGQKKIYISQLKSLIQSETEIDDLKDVVMSHKADGDIIVWNANGGVSGNGGWENKSLGTITKSNWIATQSSGNGTLLTDTLTLDEGNYIVQIKAPNSDNNIALIIRNADTMGELFVTSLSSLADSLLFIHFSGAVRIQAVSAQSATVNFSNLGRGGLNAIKIS